MKIISRNIFTRFCSDVSICAGAHRDAPLLECDRCYGNHNLGDRFSKKIMNIYR